MSGTLRSIHIAAVLLLGTLGVTAAGILDADTLKNGTYRSASFTVW